MFPKITQRLAQFLLAILVCAHVAEADQPRDWANWRGPEQNGISREKNLPEKWSPKGENLLWRKADFGTRCTPIAMNGKLYFITRHKPETTEEGERTVCLDAKTGELIWESVHNIFLSDAPAERVGWASVVGDPETGNIYSFGLGCLFQCLDGNTGKVIWERAMSEEFGMLSTYGGRTNYPVVYEDIVYISGVMTNWGDLAVPAHRIIAMDKRSGAILWIMSTRARPEDTTYSTPVFTTFNGNAAMVFGAADGAIYAIQPRTGKVIWKHDVSQRGFNTTPLVVGNTVFCGHGEKNRADTTILGGVWAMDGSATGEIPESQLLWKNFSKVVSRSAPLYVDGRVYMVEDGGSLMVMDAKSGKIVQEKKVGRIMFGSLIYGDGKIYCAEATGIFWVLKPTEKGVEEVSRVRLNNEEILSSPIISNGRIYLTTTEAIYCIGNENSTVDADPIPEPKPELPVDSDQQVAHIQITPAEMLSAPSGKIQYQVRTYNSRGQFLGLADNASFTVEGQGDLTSDGKLTIGGPGKHHILKVTAKLGEMTSLARVRVVPPLPWKFDFNDGQVPMTWIGAAYRHQPKEFEGEKMLVKVSTIPKGTRSQSWMGQTHYSDYTIQGDFYPTTANDLKPDMGLINQRYTLDLMGKNQLQIRSWTPRLELRFAKTIPYQWEPNQWYTLKFQSENRADQVVLRGKVWKRGETEPTEWSIEAADKTPNRTGSPGLFGNSSVAEVYIDNIQVVPNK